MRQIGDPERFSASWQSGDDMPGSGFPGLAQHTLETHLEGRFEKAILDGKCGASSGNGVLTHHCSSISVSALGQRAALPHHLLGWPGEAILTVGEQEEKRAARGQAPVTSFGPVRDGSPGVGDPSVVVSLTAWSPGNGYAARQPLLVECADDFPS